MKTTVDPVAAVASIVRAVALVPRSVGLFAESSSPMFYVTRALGELDLAPYCRISTHYGSMGHALAGALGFCAATGRRAVVVTGDGSFDLMNPMRTAVKHELALTVIVLNDSRLGLPYFGSGRVGATHAQATTSLAERDFTCQGLERVRGWRVDALPEFDAALAKALAAEGCYVIDALIDPDVTPPVGGRLDSVDALFGTGDVGDVACRRSDDRAEAKAAAQPSAGVRAPANGAAGGAAAPPNGRPSAVPRDGGNPRAATVATVAPPPTPRQTIEVAGHSIGPTTFAVIAGPCSVISADQTVRVARQVNDAGATMLRGGAYKPRSDPRSFQGLGERGLAMLLEAKAQTGLAVVTELLDLRDLDCVLGVADVIQVGARNMHNTALLKALGETDCAVLLKRGLAATIDETVSAADYIRNAGNQRVILCERGIRTFETAYRFTLDLTAVPILQERSGLPVFVDPSHGPGRRDLVTRLSKAAVAVGADGVIVEVDENPDQAASDGPQQLRIEDLPGYVGVLRRMADIEGRRLLGGDGR